MINKLWSSRSGNIIVKKTLWLLTCQNISFFVYSADNSKNSITVWAKYLSASKSTYLAPSENALDY